MRAQSGLHMPDRYLPVKRRQRAGKARGGVPVDEHQIRLFPVQHRLDGREYFLRYRKERLPRLHDSQIVFRLDAEHIQHLPEHLPVLPRDAHDRLKRLRTARERLYQRAHFDGLRPRAEANHDFFHVLFFRRPTGRTGRPRLTERPPPRCGTAFSGPGPD